MLAKIEFNLTLIQVTIFSFSCSAWERLLGALMHLLESPTPMHAHAERGNEKHLLRHPRLRWDDEEMS